MGKGLQVERLKRRCNGKGLQIERPRNNNGLQIDSTPRNYRKIPINDEKKAKISRLPYF